MAEPRKITPGEASRSITISRQATLVERVTHSQKHRPSVQNPPPVNPIGNAVFSRHKYRRPPIRQSVDNGAIKRLSRPVCPSAIRGAVSFSVVLPFNGQVVSIASARSPISESFERRPLRANGDAFSSVIPLVDAIASTMHVLPDGIEARARLPMRPASGDYSFNRQTSAGPRFSRSQVASDYHALLATFASAQPKRSSPRRVALLAKDRPAVELLPVQPNLSGVLAHA
jgi:hypothetical protein